ncbi:MAG: DUF4411 family protein [Proteobacteria bacterium]|nr:DUF4411 family protein [Pseudomonadota bacterium]
MGIVIYIFDTNAFIAWWHEIYPPQSFPDIRVLIEQNIGGGTILSPIEVRKELEEKVDDNLTVWAKKQHNLFVIEQIDLQLRIAEISNAYPKLVKQHKKINADPIVIAVAEAGHSTVVTQENPVKQNNIVGCCRDIGVMCISLSQYINNHKDSLNIIRKKLWGNG